MPLTAILGVGAIDSRAQSDFTVVASPDAAELCTIGLNTFAHFDVELQSLAGFSQPVSLLVAGLPTGAGAVFNPNPVTPPGLSTLTIEIEFEAAGSYPLGIRGSAARLTRADAVVLDVYDECSVTISVSEPLQCDFFEVSYDLDFEPINGFSDIVTLTVSEGLPAAVTASFSSNPVDPPGSSTLTIGNLGAVSPGYYPLTLEANSVLQIAEKPLVLVVPVAWLNDIDAALECDACTLVSPASFSVPTGGSSPPITGRILEAGFTEGAGGHPSIQAEFGYGPLGSDPRSDCRWRWFPAGFAGQSSSADDYVGSLQIDEPGTWSYTFRFSRDGGESATAADRNGAGSQPGLTFERGLLGVATVPEPAGAGPGLLAMGVLATRRRARRHSRNSARRTRTGEPGTGRVSGHSEQCVLLVAIGPGKIAV